MTTFLIKKKTRILRILSDCLFHANVFSTLTQASGKNLNLNDESQHGLLMQLLKLSYNCLNYDFIGTSTDESSDDLCTVQIPTSWRSGQAHHQHVHLFFCLSNVNQTVRFLTQLVSSSFFFLQRFLIPQHCSSFSICTIPSLHPFPRW